MGSAYLVFNDIISIFLLIEIRKYRLCGLKFFQSNEENKGGDFFPNIMLNNILFKIFELVQVFLVGFVSTQTQSNFFKVNIGVIYTTFHVKNHNYNPIFIFFCII